MFFCKHYLQVSLSVGGWLGCEPPRCLICRAKFTLLKSCFIFVLKPYQNILLGVSYSLAQVPIFHSVFCFWIRSPISHLTPSSRWDGRAAATSAPSLTHKCCQELFSSQPWKSPIVSSCLHTWIMVQSTLEGEMLQVWLLGDEFLFWHYIFFLSLLWFIVEKGACRSLSR